MQDTSKATRAVGKTNRNFQLALQAKTGERVIVTKKGQFIVGNSRPLTSADASATYDVPYVL